MDQSGAGSCSFIIKVWLEEGADEGGKVRWRGHITHVPSKERRYFQRLRDVEIFVDRHLHEMGVRPSLLWRLKKWIRKPRMFKAERK